MSRRREPLPPPAHAGACDPVRELTEEATEEFGALLRYTVAGWLAGLALGAALDAAGRAASGLGQGLVRTFAGEGESVFEGLFALRRRLGGARVSFAQAYGWGKLAGLALPWAVDAASRLAGLDVNGPLGFHVPYLYAMSDQLGALVAGWAFLRRETGSAAVATRAWAAHPVMRAGLAVALAAPAGLALARGAGFTPSTQVLTALETMAANLCWVPPAVGRIAERRARRAGAA